MMNDIIVATQLRVFVFKYIEAMGADRHNLFHLVHIQQLNILVGHHLEKKFVACTTGGISGAHFLFSQDSILNSYMVKDSGKGFGYFLSPLVETAGASHPKKNFRCFAV